MSVDAGGVNDQANQGSEIPANFTQEQVNHFAAQARRGAVATYFKELGLDAPPAADELKGTLAKAAEYDKLQAGQKSETEVLTANLAAEKEKSAEVPTLKTQLRRAQIANDAGLKSRLWKYVDGETDEDIEASVKVILDDVGGTGEGAPPQGTGRPAPNPQQGRPGGGAVPKTMKAGADAYKAKHNRE